MEVAHVAVCVGELSSITFTVKLELPALVGVPEIMPAPDSVSPAGRVPEATDQLYAWVPPAALNAALYPLPSRPAESVVVVIVSCGAPIVSEIAAVCVCAGELLSVTATVKFELPLAVGVPEITPAFDSVRPAGRLPEEIDHVYPGVPPLALSVKLYATPTCPAPSVVVLIVNGAVVVVGEVVMEKLAVFVCAGDSLSVTATVKFEVPLAVGVPEITPALDKVRPAGRLPAFIDQVYPGVPPPAASVAL
jgi:hypothetical protein